MKYFLVIVGLLVMASIAIGQDAGEAVMNLEEVLKPDADLPLEMVEKSDPQMTTGWLSTIIAWVIGIQIMLRGLAEGLTRIAVRTKTNTDNKIAGWLSEAAWILGVAVGKLGYSVPKLVIEEKAMQMKNEKST